MIRRSTKQAVLDMIGEGDTRVFPSLRTAKEAAKILRCAYPDITIHVYEMPEDGPINGDDTNYTDPCR